MPPRDVEPDVSDGPDALPRRSPGAAPLPRAVHLGLVEGAYVLYRHPEALNELRGDRFLGPVYLSSWNLDLPWPNPVEAFGIFEEGRISSFVDVLDDPACCVAYLLGEKAAGTA